MLDKGMMRFKLPEPYNAESLLLTFDSLQDCNDSFVKEFFDFKECIQISEDNV